MTIYSTVIQKLLKTDHTTNELASKKFPVNLVTENSYTRTHTQIHTKSSF